jgi:hypothetical protein
MKSRYCNGFSDLPKLELNYNPSQLRSQNSVFMLKDKVMLGLALRPLSPLRMGYR